MAALFLVDLGFPASKVGILASDTLAPVRFDFQSVVRRSILAATAARVAASSCAISAGDTAPIGRPAGRV